MTPTPHDAELLAPALPRLLAELAAAPDPDMALNNLERYAAAVDRAVLFRTLAEHPGAAPLLARVGGASQFLADVLRRRPNALAWLLEPRTMRAWLAEEFAADAAQAVRPFTTREARMNALRRFKYRQILRIGARDLLGDADLAVTTEELSRLADACLAQATADALDAARARFGAPLDAAGRETGLAVVGMGKLGGEELNYSSDVDLMFVYGAEGETAGGPEGRLENGEYFARACRDVVAMIEEVTEEGYAFRVDLRLRPEGRMGPVAMSLDAYGAYHRDRAELWERQALLKARAVAGDQDVGARFMDWAGRTVYRTGVDERVLPAIHGMKREIDRALRGRHAEASARNVKLGRGGIREVEFLVQALQLLYGGDDPWLRERNSLKALFRLTERGYLAPDLGRRTAAATALPLVRSSTGCRSCTSSRPTRCPTIRSSSAVSRVASPSTPRRASPRAASRPSTAPSRATCTARSGSSSASARRRRPRDPGCPAAWRSPPPASPIPSAPCRISG